MHALTEIFTFTNGFMHSMKVTFFRSEVLSWLHCFCLAIGSTLVYQTFLHSGLHYAYTNFDAFVICLHFTFYRSVSSVRSVDSHRSVGSVNISLEVGNKTSVGE